jgi:hypothetical protein
MGNVDGEHEFHAGEMVVDLSHPLSLSFFPCGEWFNALIQVPCVYYVFIM